MEDGAPVKEGDVLAGKYRIERVLGIGGMGVVVAATHIQLDQRGSVGHDLGHHAVVALESEKVDLFAVGMAERDLVHGGLRGRLSCGERANEEDHGAKFGGKR